MSQSGKDKVNDGGEPLTKRGRLESSTTDVEADESDAIDKILEEAAVVQKQVETLIDEENKEVVKVQEEFAKKRLDFYERRSKILQTIPHFWTDVILRSPVADFLNDDDIAIMEYLTEIRFVESSNPQITFCFSENPFFSNKEIVKSFRVVEDGLESQEYTINWAPGQNIAERSKARAGGKGSGKQRRERNGKESFFLWFSNEAAFDENNMVDAIRELYQYPISLFTQEDAEEVDLDVGSDHINTGFGKISSGQFSMGNEEEEDDDDDDEGMDYEGEEDDDYAYDDGKDSNGNNNSNRSVSPMLRQTNREDFGDEDDEDEDDEDDDDK